MPNNGARYKLTMHPDQPTGKVIGFDHMTGNVTIEWDDPTLIPPYDEYPEYSFEDGTFVLLDEPEYTITQGNKHCWSHQWVKYVGIKEEYEYCNICDAKRFKK